MRTRISILFSNIHFLLAVSISCFMVGTFSNCTPDQTTPPAPVKEQYMGSINCASCHEKEYQDWQGSHHDLAMQEAADSTVLGDFANVIFESNDVKSRFFKKSGKFFVNTEGPEGMSEDFEVLYTFGVTPLQQYMVALPGGRLQCLLTAWDTEKLKWFDLMPDERQKSDDWLHWTGGSMTWNTMCADCHSTYLEKNFDEQTRSYQTEWSIINVSCEACHGPGQKHVTYVNSSDFESGKRVSGSHLKLTADIDSKQQVNDCARCHARRGQISEVFDHSGDLMDHYIPDILRPGLYHADGQILDEVYVYGSFLQSKMYRSSVRCTDCHNAHSMELKFEGNNLCTQCHVPAKYDDVQHHFHEPGSESAQCINCHMPGKIYMGNDFRRDHSFRIPRPDLSARYETPNACNGCHNDQSSKWASKAIETWYGPDRKEHFSDILVPSQNGDQQALPGLMSMLGDTSKPEIAQATAIWLLGQMNVEQVNPKVIEALKNENPMIRYSAVNAMEYASSEDKVRHLSSSLNDPVKAVRTQTAYVMANVPEQLLLEDQKADLDKAIQEYLDVLKIQADFPSGQLQRGQFFHKKKNYVQAEKAYLEALWQDPYLSQVHFNLANLYYQQQQLDKAEQAFNDVIRLQPDAVDAYYSLGLLQAEMQNLEGAEASLGKAAQLSENPRYYYNWGLTLQTLKRPDEAEKAYKKGLSLNPESEAILNALAILYLQQNRQKDADPIVRHLLQINPSNPNYQNLLSALQ